MFGGWSNKSGNKKNN